MRNRALSLLAAGIVAGLAMAPLAAPAHEGHCGQIFILSGFDPDDNWETRAGTNPGAVSCTLNDPELHEDTNYTVPASTHLWVAVSMTNSPSQPNGQIVIGDGAPIQLTFVNNSLRSRWESLSVDLSEVAPLTSMTATVEWGSTPRTITYTRI